MKKTKNKTLKNQLIVILCLIIIASALIEAHYFATINDVGFAEAQVIEKVKEKNLSIQEYVFQEVEKALGMKEAIRAVSMIGGCENKAWDTDRVTPEPDGSLSYGIWQINSVHSKGKFAISNADKLDYKKATKWSIEKRIRDGHWRAWTCGRSL